VLGKRAMVSLGDLLAKQRKYAGAEQWYRKAADARPNL
jgi:hypothetical protein